MIRRGTGTIIVTNDSGQIKIANGPAKWDLMVGFGNSTELTFTTDVLDPARTKSVLLTFKVKVSTLAHESGDHGWTFTAQFSSDSDIMMGPDGDPHHPYGLKGHYDSKNHQGFVMVNPDLVA